MNTSIITSMYNRKPQTIEVIDKLFFPSLLNNASSDKEIVIMDDASPLETETKTLIDKYMPDLKTKFGNVVISRNPQNYGFGKSFNKGIEISSGKELLIANDDLYFPLETIDTLISTLSENNNYGIVGPITNEVNTWTYQYCKQAPHIKAYTQNQIMLIEDFAKFTKEKMKGIRIKNESISGFCFVLKADTIKEIGVFDERFEYGAFEDTDLVRRISQKYDVVINAEVYINHGGANGSSGSLNQQPLRAIKHGLRNATTYAKKWGNLETIKHCTKGIIRSSTGKYTISEEFEKFS